MKLVPCRDCLTAVSITAATCPHCGSGDPVPLRLSRREQRNIRIQDRNDNRLVVITVLCLVLGAGYGILSADSLFYRVSLASFYGLIGATIGASTAFVLNVFLALRP